MARFYKMKSLLFFSFDKLICGHTYKIQCTLRSEERMAFFRRKTEIHNKAHGPGKQNVFWIYFATSPFSCCNLETSADAFFFSAGFFLSFAKYRFDAHADFVQRDFVSINCAWVNKVTEKLDSKLWVVRAWLNNVAIQAVLEPHTHNNTNNEWIMSSVVI